VATAEGKALPLLEEDQLRVEEEGPQASRTHKGKGKEKEKEKEKGGRPQQQQQQGPAKCPPLKKDFYGWLSFRKAQWRAARRERRMMMGQGGRGGREAGVGSRRTWEGEGDLALAAGSSSGGRSKKHVGVDSLLRNAALAVTQGCWQILEVRETEIPGDFVVWAMTGPRSLQRLQLQIERQFFVASNIDHEHAFLALGGRKASKACMTI
jgi:hypothetical protein